MPSRVNINIPPPLVEKAKVAQRANRQALDEKQRNASLRKKIAQRVIVESATSQSENRRGGLLEFRQGHHWAVRSKRRLILNEPWLLVPDADYEGDVLKTRTGPYHATSPANQRFLYIGQAIEAQNVVQVGNNDTRNKSRLTAEVSNFTDLKSYTIEAMVRLGKAPFTTTERNGTGIYADTTYTVILSRGYFLLNIGLLVFEAEKVQRVFVDPSDPSSGGYSPSNDWRLTFGGTQDQLVAGLGDGNFYHIAACVTHDQGIVKINSFFNGQQFGNTITYSYEFPSLPGFFQLFIDAENASNSTGVTIPSDEGLCAVSGIRFTPDRILYPSTGFTPPTSITTFA